MGPSSVTVVIPVHNRQTTLARALRSVERQTWSAAEVIVVDDGSDDTSAAIAQEFGATVVSHVRNLGVSAARNSGLNSATTAWVAFLDSDDEWLPHHLATMCPQLGTHVLVSSSAIAMANGCASRILGHPSNRPVLISRPAALLFPDNFVPTSASVVHRDTAHALGGFDPSLTRAEDLDLWVRMLEVGTGYALPTVTARYHLHPAQVSEDRATMRDAHADLISRYDGRSWFRPRIRRATALVAAWDQARGASSRHGRIGRPLGLLRVAMWPLNWLFLGRLLFWRWGIRQRTRETFGPRVTE